MEAIRKAYRPTVVVHIRVVGGNVLVGQQQTGGAVLVGEDAKDRSVEEQRMAEQQRGGLLRRVEEWQSIPAGGHMAGHSETGLDGGKAAVVPAMEPAMELTMVLAMAGHRHHTGGREGVDEGRDISAAGTDRSMGLDLAGAEEGVDEGGEGGVEAAAGRQDGCVVGCGCGCGCGCRSRHWLVAAAGEEETWAEVVDNA